jgi:RHS repeat-associated protein
VARHDYRPFGEELVAGDGFRGAEWGKYDSVTQKFTGQEHDGETQFDFFHARYLSGAQQRFMSPDPGNAGADPMNPQSWNAYAYVNNNPLNATDPTGMYLSLLPPKDKGNDDDGGYNPGDPCLFCLFPRCILCFGPGGGAPAPEPPPPPDKPGKNDVNKTWSRTFSCASGATHVMAAVQNDMGTFADNQSLFASRFPDNPIRMGGSYSVFPGLNNAQGGMLPSLIGPYPTGSLEITVSQISANGWTFTTNASQHYINGTVSFSASDAGNGNVTFSIHAQGDWSNAWYRLWGPLIKLGEDSNWNNMLNNVQGFCAAGG